jgi:hypothetical protein
MVEDNPTAWNLQRVAFAIVAVHMAARGCESVYLDWENVNLTTPFDNAGEGCIMIKGWYRGKNVQGAKKESSIKGRLGDLREVQLYVLQDATSWELVGEVELNYSREKKPNGRQTPSLAPVLLQV